MGHGGYSTTYSSADDTFVREDVIRTARYAKSSLRETFSNKSINNAMNPHGITVRESRDSDEHPNSLAIIIALDVTGSMGSVPYFMIQKGLPDIMGRIIQAGIDDPQVLFLGIGDHECDDAPLQVGQFESSDELLDKWLQEVYLEGGGGGNKGESYHLAWMFGAYHTAIDCLEKRGTKGALFTIGDEPVLDKLPSHDRIQIMGDGSECQVTDTHDLLKAAREKYHVYHINICETHSGARQHVQDGWRQLMHDDLLLVRHKEDIGRIIADKLIRTYGAQKIVGCKAHEQSVYDICANDNIDEEMML